MRLLDLSRDYLDAAVSGAGAGIKSMLLDEEAMAAISIAHPQSRLMSRGVYLFEKLEDHPARRRQHQLSQQGSLPFVTCVAVASPRESNVALLKAEVAAPRFGRYHLYFTGHLASSAVKALAEADTKEVVASLSEIPLGFRALDNHLFLGGGGAGATAAASICSLIDCLDVRPELCYTRASDACRSLCGQLSRHWRAQGRIGADLSPSSARGGSVLVLLFDRRLDPVTPLLNQWTYQAMIHEAFGIRNNVVQIEGKDGKLEKVMVSPDDDEFFRANLYKNFGEIGEVIRELVSAYQDRVANHKGSIESVSDIKDFIASYPEFQKMSGTVSKHVNLLGEISKFVTAHSLLEVSELEQSLANKEDSSSGGGAGSVTALLQNRSNLRKVDVLRLLCLFFVNRELRVNLDSQEVNVACKVHGISRREIECLFRNLRDFSMLDCISSSSRLNQLRAAGGAGQATTELLRNSGRKIFRGLKGTENVFTQHEPVLSQIVSSLVRTGQSPAVSFESAATSGTSLSKNVVVFVLGGITYEESKAVRDLNASLGCNVVLGGDRVLRSEEFVESFLKDK